MFSGKIVTFNEVANAIKDLLYENYQKRMKDFLLYDSDVELAEIIVILAKQALVELMIKNN